MNEVPKYIDIFVVNQPERTGTTCCLFVYIWLTFFLLFFLQVPGERHIHPTVLFSGEDAVSSASMQVAVEGLTVDVADVVEGVSLMMAMYWAFDIEYRPSARNTLVILERAMGVKETTITMTALKVIGNL